MVEVAVHLHVAHGHKAVEPCVGDGLHRGVEAVDLDALWQRLAGRGDPRREGLSTDEQHVALHLSVGGAVRSDPETGGLGAHRCDERFARFWRVAAQLRGVHRDGLT